MLSHGGARDGEGEAPRRSTGRREPDGVVTQKPDRPRPPRREMREPDAGEESARGVETMRIAKRLARAGIASRREAEGMIADGRIAVNGKVLESPALDVTAKDRIEIDGQPIPAIERTRLWLFHKPAGTVTTNHDPEGRPTVFDRLPEDMPRVLSVGRLDINTEGLLLLTNDGGLARMLELPATGWLRRYRVRAHGEIDQARLDELRQGIAVDGVFYGAIEATLDRTQGANVWLSIGLREGKNREVKRVLGHLGLEVNRLIRLSFGPFQLADLEEGAVREIKGRTLRDQLGERLIEESGADFDAPVVNAFSNKPVKAEPTPALAPKPQKRGDWISASDTAPNRKRAREDKRDDALGRLDTRPGRSGGEGRSFGARPEREGGFDGPKKSFGERKPFGDKKPFGERKPFGGRDDKAGGPPRAPAAPRRSANVWMAPGARPRKADEGEAEGGRPRGEGGFKPRSEGGAKPGFQGPKRPVSPGGPKRPPRGRG
ncbi:pseudouridylate synthase [Aurantimonas sp. Leaf443]|nr:pseudouridylate synthase [Aurantimonas sp. Leaf443]